MFCLRGRLWGSLREVGRSALDDELLTSGVGSRAYTMHNAIILDEGGSYSLWNEARNLF